MVAAKWRPKDPADIADYVVNWRPGSPFLAPGVLITASTAAIDEPQPVPGDGYDELAIVDQDHTDDISIVRFSGGGPKKYPVTFDIDVSTGEHFQTTVVLEVKERIKK